MLSAIKIFSSLLLTLTDIRLFRSYYRRTGGGTFRLRNFGKSRSLASYFGAFKVFHKKMLKLNLEPNVVSDKLTFNVIIDTI